MNDEELIAWVRNGFGNVAADRIEELLKERDALKVDLEKMGRTAVKINETLGWEAGRREAAEARAERLEAALRKAEDDFYEAANRFQDEDYEGPHENFTVNVVCHVKPYFDMHMKHLRDSAETARTALKGADHE